MAFEITYEAVEMMRNLAKKISNSVDAIHQSNVEVIKCYESVRNALGPHTRKIEAIVCDIEKLLKKNAEYFAIASNALNQQADRAQRILDMKYKFKNDLKVDVMVSWGEGSRAIVAVDFLLGGGHVFVAEYRNGRVHYMDPQNGQLDCEDYFDDINTNTASILRVDNCSFTNRVRECCEGTRHD